MDDAQFLPRTWQNRPNRQRLNKPRSRLYAEAIAEYVGIHDSHAVTERLDAVYGSTSAAVDDALRRAQLKTLADETW